MTTPPKPTKGKISINKFEMEVEIGKRVSFDNITIEYTCSEKATIQMVDLLKPLIETYTNILKQQHEQQQ